MEGFFLIFYFFFRISLFEILALNMNLFHFQNSMNDLNMEVQVFVIMELAVLCVGHLMTTKGLKRSINLILIYT